MDSYVWQKYFTVDEVIECISLGPNFNDICRELLNLMPDAYDAPVPGENDSPWEPDHSSRVNRTLSCIWDQLKPETQAVIQAGYEKDYERR